MIDTLKNQHLRAWIKEMIALCQPDHVHICDGSDEEFKIMADQLVASGTFIPLNEGLRPGSFLARSDPSDVARIEEKTFICSEREIDAGPTNHWQDPVAMKQRLNSLFRGCMRGRTMYVIAFSMGPLGSKISHIGIEITDSPYVVCNMKIMTRMGEKVLEELKDKDFIPCMHSVGVPLRSGEKDVAWPCNPKDTVIAHFPEEKSIWSFGSGYGGNALLGKKCFALRIASVMAREEGWLAEHMLIVGITNPEGKKKYFAAAFPSACGKTNLAMMRSQLPGWKVECVGDDIAWMKLGSDGRLYAINPEAGFFGVAPGTSMESNPNALLSCSKNSIFTNVALTDEHDIWWEGMTKTPPPHLIDWRGEEWTPSSGRVAAHPNSRFTTPAEQCPVIDPSWEDPQGVPISAILFGGRRSTVAPLVYEALDWEHGVMLGASVSSETTAAATGEVGKLRHDPFAMLPFCGYNMGDYFQHWLSFSKKSPEKLPRIYAVNWFRQSQEGKYLWPGFGDNIRVLKWIFERTENEDHANETPIGFVPKQQCLDLSNLSLSSLQVDEVLSIDKQAWFHEIEEMRGYLARFGEKLPEGLRHQLERLKQRLES